MWEGIVMWVGIVIEGGYCYGWLLLCGRVILLRDGNAIEGGYCYRWLLLCGRVLLYGRVLLCGRVILLMKGIVIWEGIILMGGYCYCGWKLLLCEFNIIMRGGGGVLLLWGKFNKLCLCMGIVIIYKLIIN